MVDFFFLETLSIKILENREKIKALDARLSDINMRLHEIPLHRSTEASFAKMIGESYEDNVINLENAKKELEEQKKLFEIEEEEQIEKFISEITSQSIVIPINPKPTIKDKKTFYKYRDEAKFENLFRILSELLGLSLPLVIKDVMLTPTEIVISEEDEYEAKQKFLTIISEVQNTLLIKKRN
ncbi:MAG: hypothetical protein PVG23_07805 [Nitrosopumilaceae archaeon]|jgi:hypothetical protein